MSVEENDESISVERVQGPSGVDCEKFICCICQNIIWQGVMCSSCETSFCRNCIAGWLRQSAQNTCPMRCETYREQQCSRFFRNQLLELQIECIYKLHGCEQIVSYENIEDHQRNCDYRLQSCSGCEMLTVKKYLAGHESQCPSICVTCQDCSTVYRRSGAATSHSDVICLTAQLQQLHHTLQNTQNRLNQETELLQQVNQQLIQLQERNEQLEQQIQILDHTCEEHLRERSKQRLLCYSPNIPRNARWNISNPIYIGNRRRRNVPFAFRHPRGIYVDIDQTIYVADYDNHRIIQWRPNAPHGILIAGGNGQGNGLDQLHGPTDVLVDKETDSILICDRENKRIVRWPLNGNDRRGEVVFENIRCCGIAMDKERFIYVSDYDRHQVVRFRIGEINGVVVAGSIRRGRALNQLFRPTFITVDQNQSIYVADTVNCRIVKWTANATSGIIVAGGREGNSLTELHHPNGLYVSSSGCIFVADRDNHRIIQFVEGNPQGTVILGEPDQQPLINRPEGLSFDRYGNLYVAEYGNHQIIRLSIQLT